MAITYTQLSWSSPVTNKKYAIDLTELKRVDSGKQTANFKKKTSAEANDAHCFSLICQSTTIDIEVPTPQLRDQLVIRFVRIIDKLKETQPIPTSPFGM